MYNWVNPRPYSIKGWVGLQPRVLVEIVINFIILWIQPSAALKNGNWVICAMVVVIINRCIYQNFLFFKWLHKLFGKFVFERRSPRVCIIFVIVNSDIQVVLVLKMALVYGWFSEYLPGLLAYWIRWIV